MRFPLFSAALLGGILAVSGNAPQAKADGATAQPPTVTPAAFTPRGTIVFTEDFEHGTASDAWSDRTVTSCPNGKTQYLGPFGPGKVTLSLHTLPEHQALRLSFTLHILGSWDGVGKWGPDRWNCGLRGGPLFMETTFNNCFLIWCDNIWQSFPESYNEVQQDVFKGMPARPPLLLACHGGSGAAGIADLGFIWHETSCSTTYKFNFVIPHGAADATLEFSNLCDDLKDNQSFALDDVRVETLADVPALGKEDAERAWQALLTGSPVAAFRAAGEFLAHPDELFRHCRQMLAADPARVQQLLNHLDTGSTRAEALFADMEPGDDQERIAALRELTLMPGDRWNSRQDEDTFDAAHPQGSLTLLSWRRVMADKQALSSTPLVRGIMRIASLLRQHGTPEAVKMAEACEDRVSSNTGNTAGE